MPPRKTRSSSTADEACEVSLTVNCCPAVCKPRVIDTCYTEPFKLTSEDTTRLTACTQPKQPSEDVEIDWFKAGTSGVQYAVLQQLKEDDELEKELEAILEETNALRKNHQTTAYVVQCTQSRKIKYIPDISMWMDVNKSLLWITGRLLWGGSNSKTYEAADIISFLQHIITLLRRDVWWELQCIQRYRSIDVIEPQLETFLQVLCKIKQIHGEDKGWEYVKEVCAPDHDIMSLHASLRHAAALLFQKQLAAKCAGFHVALSAIHTVAVQKHRQRYAQNLPPTSECECRLVAAPEQPGEDAYKEIMAWTNVLGLLGDFPGLHDIAQAGGDMFTEQFASKVGSQLKSGNNGRSVNLTAAINRLQQGARKQATSGIQNKPSAAVRSPPLVLGNLAGSQNGKGGVSPQAIGIAAEVEPAQQAYAAVQKLVNSVKAKEGRGAEAAALTGNRGQNLDAAEAKVRRSARTRRGSSKAGEFREGQGGQRRNVNPAEAVALKKIKGAEKDFKSY